MKSRLYLIMVVCSLFFQVTAWAFSEPKNPQDDCVRAWWGSSAKQTCPRVYYHYANPNKSCYIDVDCKASDGATMRNNKFTGSVDQFKALRNCDGRLKIGSC